MDKSKTPARSEAATKPGFRLDRAVTLGLIRPVREVFSGQTQNRIPILMYHSIQDGASDKRPYFDINTSPDRFAQQMKFLREQGYRAVHLEEAWRLLAADRWDSRYVVITFD